jgi:hypothetical protein
MVSGRVSSSCSLVTPPNYHFWLPCRHLPELSLLVTLSASSRITTPSYPVGIFPNYHFWLPCRHLVLDTSIHSTKTNGSMLCFIQFIFHEYKIVSSWDSNRIIDLLEVDPRKSWQYLFPNNKDIFIFRSQDLKHHDFVGFTEVTLLKLLNYPKAVVTTSKNLRTAGE